MSVQTYLASDSGALYLTGQVGSLENILISCLVAGYGSKQPAGWTNPYYDGLHNSVLKAEPLGNEFYLRLNDGYTGYENIMVMCGFSKMTALNTGDDATPSAVQSPFGVGVLKSITKDAIARGWMIVANNKFFYLFINHNSSSNFATADGYCFGEFISFRDINLDPDKFNLIISGRSPTDYNNVSNSFGTFSPTNESIPNHWLMRSYTQVGSSILCGKHSDTSKDLLPFPNPVDGNLFLSPVFVTEPTINCVRGRLPGLWNVCHNGAYFNHGDTFNGNGALAGKSFMIVKCNGRTYALETSDTWYA